jgi:uncharacterized protein YkwD
MSFPKFSFFLKFLLFSSFIIAQPKESPLSKYSKLWNQGIYKKANTADSVSYLNETEKEVIYILNLARVNPKLFNETVVKKYKMRMGDEYQKTNRFYHSLITYLDTLHPLKLLYADSNLFVSAQCHAVTAGKAGYFGHERQDPDCKVEFDGECCQYGENEALDILMNLLIDENIPSLGHRFICMSFCYSKIGLAKRYHSKYGSITVLDFAEAPERKHLALRSCVSF